MSVDEAELAGQYPNPPTGFKKVIHPSLRERDRFLAAGKISMQNSNVNKSLRRYQN